MSSPAPRQVGPYLLQRRLGAGGMGSVWVAEELAIGRTVALKLLHVERDSAFGRERFKREARALARVQHPSVVRVHAFGIPEGAGEAWLATELIPGQDLQLATATGPLEPIRAARIARDLADALAACHEVGVLHRDLKPANAILRPDGRPALVDFGLARVEGQHTMTRTGAMIGTPAYMPPEQADGTRADERSDVYGLGSILYHLLTGRAPIEGHNPHEVIRALLQGQPPWPRELRPEVPAGLDAIVRQAMAKDPGARYPSAAALRDALDGWLRPGREEPALGRLGRALLLLGLLLLGGAGIALLAARRAEQDSPTTPAPQASAARPEQPPVERATRHDPLRQPSALRDRPLRALPPRDKPGRRGQGAARLEFLDDQHLLVASGQLPRLDVWDLVEDRLDPAAELATPGGPTGLARLPGRVFAIAGAAVFRFELRSDVEGRPTLAPDLSEGPAAPWQSLGSSSLLAIHAAAGLVLVGAADGKAWVLNPTGGVAAAIPAGDYPVFGVAVSPDGRDMVLVGGWLGSHEPGSPRPPHGEIRVWRREGDELRGGLARDPGIMLNAVVCAGTQRFVTGSELAHLDRYGLPWDPAPDPVPFPPPPGREAMLPTAHESAVAALEWHPGGGGRPARLWSASRATTIVHWPSEGQPPPMVVRAWDPAEPAEPRLLGTRVVRGPVSALRASPDGELLAIGFEDGAVEVWRAD